MGRLARRTALVTIFRALCKAPDNKQAFVRIDMLFAITTASTILLAHGSHRLRESNRAIFLHPNPGNLSLLLITFEAEGFVHAVLLLGATRYPHTEDPRTNELVPKRLPTRT